MKKLYAILSLLFLTSNLLFSQAPNWSWAKKIGGSHNVDEPRAIATDASNNVYVVGLFGTTVDFDPGPAVYNLTASIYNADMYILKLDSAGNFIWVKRISSSGDTQMLRRWCWGTFVILFVF